MSNEHAASETCTRVQGIVTAFRPEKGFGFISDAKGTAHFVHFTALQMPVRTLVPNQRVEFTPKGDGTGRFQATEVVAL